MTSLMVLHLCGDIIDCYDFGRCIRVSFLLQCHLCFSSVRQCAVHWVGPSGCRGSLGASPTTGLSNVFFEGLWVNPVNPSFSYSFMNNYILQELYVFANQVCVCHGKSGTGLANFLHHFTWHI